MVLRSYAKKEATKNGVIQMAARLIVAVHGNKPIPIGTLKSIIEGAGLTAEDFR